MIHEKAVSCFDHASTKVGFGGQFNIQLSLSSADKVFVGGFNHLFNQKRLRNISYHINSAPVNYENNSCYVDLLFSDGKTFKCSYYVILILSFEYILYCAFKNSDSVYSDRVQLVHSTHIQNLELVIALPEVFSPILISNLQDAFSDSLLLDTTKSTCFVRSILPISVVYFKNYCPSIKTPITYLFVDVGAVFVTLWTVQYCNVCY